MKVLIITSSDTFRLLPMWCELFDRLTTFSFHVIVIQNTWRVKKDTCLHAVHDLSVSLLLYILHYGWGNTLKKIMYKCIAFITGESPEKSFYIKRCSRYNIPLSFTEGLNTEVVTQVVNQFEPSVALYQSPVKCDMKFIQRFHHGVINRHPSLLPYYRGCFPIFWAMLNKDYGSIGVSLFRMNDQYDAGEVLMQKPLAVNQTDTLMQVYEKSYLDGVALYVEVLKGCEKNQMESVYTCDELGSYYGWPSFLQLLKFAWRRLLKCKKEIDLF